MKAVVYKRYGGPEVLEIREVPKPEPKEDEVLVRIHATTVNRTDCGFRRCEYFIIRLIHGFFRPRKQILGSEFSGTVEKSGAAVREFRPGDAVFGLSTYRFGTHAEYLCIREKKSITHKPENVSHEEAAAVCDGLMLGTNFIKNVDFNRPQKILVNGASGSIGSACVQLARYYGAEITAVAHPRSFDILRSLGIQDLIDYTREDFTQNGQLYDFVFDTVGKSSFFRCKKILKPKGVYISSELGPGWQNTWLPLWTAITGGKRVKFPIPTDSKKDVEFFAQLIGEGRYKAIIDRTYPLEEIVEATRFVESEQKVGNVVIQMMSEK